ncbi:hexokinase-domain-containing protein [Spinellus fusiger]|nr:hexokinase-domain-containing protein [Spinellus fusiger]
MSSTDNNENIKTKEQTEALGLLHQEFKLSAEELKDLAQHMVVEMGKGLQSHNSNVPMLLSYVRHHPTGQEKGEYLALEVSGSYARLLLVQLHGQGRISTRQQKYRITEDLKRDAMSKLIDFLAQSVNSFLRFVKKQDVKEPLALGFSISFPLNQTALHHASIGRWTKDFEITGTDDKNLASLLQEGIEKLKLPVVVKAIVNGTVGCLLAHNYRSLDTLLACTVSTGTNAAYWEKTEKIIKCNLESKDKEEEMIIDTEWGSFGDKSPEHLPRTCYDNRLNRESINPGIHLFEKMVSGMYLGEIIRSVIVDFVDRRLLFNGNSTKEMNTPYSFDVSYMSAIELDNSDDLKDIQHIVEAIMNVPKTTLVDRQMVKSFCELIGQRAARLTAAAISAVIEKRGALETGLPVSVEGTIYEHYPNFPERMNNAMREIYGPKIANINIGVTKDGNGIGAALAAMIACTKE